MDIADFICKKVHIGFCSRFHPEVVMGGEIDLQLTEGFVKATTDLSKYKHNAGWMEFRRADGLILCGDGTFNGQGVKAWSFNKCFSNSTWKLLPTNLKFLAMYRTVVRGIRSMDSYSTFSSPSAKSFAFQVENGRTMELTIAQFWSSGLGSNDFFHGINVNEEVVLDGSAASARIDAEALLFTETLDGSETPASSEALEGSLCTSALAPSFYIAGQIVSICLVDIRH